MRANLRSTRLVLAAALTAGAACVDPPLDDLDPADPADEALRDDDAAIAPAAAGAAARVVGAACPSMPMLTSRTAPVPGTTRPGLPLPYPDCQAPVAEPVVVRACAGNAACRDVTAFGAIPDDAGDDTAAIQRAIDAAPAGGLVYLPAGRYVINAGVAAAHLAAGRAITAASFGLQLRGRTDLQLVGAGDAATVLEDRFAQPAFDAASAVDLQAPVGTIYVEGGVGITIARLGLVSAGGFACDARPYAGLVSGVFVSGGRSLAVTEIAARHYNRAGVYVTGASSAARAAYPHVVANLLQQNRVAGLYLGFTAGAVVERNRFYDNGRFGDGSTGYGMAGVSSQPPFNTRVECNLADYTVRKGLDFHAALGTTLIRHNHAIASGVGGIFVGGYADLLDGKITIDDNRVATMSPAITDGTHGLGASGTGAGVVGIWTYPKFTTASTTAPVFVVQNNRIEDFGGDGGTQVYAPFQVRAEAFSRGRTTLTGNVVEARGIHQVVMANDVGPGRLDQELTVRGNRVTYARVLPWSFAREFIQLPSATTVAISGNTFRTTAAPATAPDRWDDAAVAGCRLAGALRVIGAAPTTCTVASNQWFR